MIKLKSKKLTDSANFMSNSKLKPKSKIINNKKVQTTTKDILWQELCIKSKNRNLR